MILFRTVFTLKAQSVWSSKQRCDKKKKKKRKSRSLFSILPSDISSGGLVECNGVSNFALQVRGDNVDNVV